MKQKQSYSSLKRDLNCANAEAQGYLDRLIGVEAELERGKKFERESAFAWSLCQVLMQALKDAQNKRP